MGTQSTGNAGFCGSYSQTAITEVVGGAHQAGGDRLAQEALHRTLQRQINLGRAPRNGSTHLLQIAAASQAQAGIGGSLPRLQPSPKQPDRIAAIAPVSGVMTTNLLESCAPARRVPVLQIHGTADTLINYQAAQATVWIADMSLLAQVAVEPEQAGAGTQHDACS